MQPHVAEAFEKMYRRYRLAPVEFVKEVLHLDPTPAQLDILDAYGRAINGDKNQPERYMAVKSGQGGGKTTVETCIALHWCFHAIGARMRVLGVSIDQLKDTWMAEIRLILDRAEPWFTAIITMRTKDVLFFDDPDWSIRLVPAKDITKVQGRHHKHLGFIIDEASGVPRDIFEVVDGTLQNDDRLFAHFGNPNYRSTYQFDCFNILRDSWWCYTIDCENSPIADKDLHARIAKLYGIESDVYRIRVKGEFPSKDPQSVMSSDDVEACMTHAQEARKFELIQMGGGVRQFGIDFARKGNDNSVIFRRSGNAVVQWKAYSKREPMDICSEAFEMQHDARWRTEETLYVPDADGMGQGCMGMFRGKKRFEFHTSGVPRHRQYANAMTEAFFQMGALVKERAVLLPRDSRLVQELSTRNYEHNLKGQLILETKKEWRKRVQVEISPDMDDACVMAFYDRSSMTGKVSAASQAETLRVTSDWAPVGQKTIRKPKSRVSSPRRMLR